MRLSFFLPLVAGGLLCLEGAAWAQTDDLFKAQQAQAKAEAQRQKEATRERERKAKERAKHPPDSRLDQIIHPDTEQQFDLTKEKRFGIKRFSSSPSNSAVDLKTSPLPQKFDSKEYLTGGFRGEKNFWMGDFKYSVGDANTKPRTFFFLPGKTYKTAAAPVKDAPGSSKSFADVNATLPTRDYRGGGAFGRSNGLDQQRWDNPLSPDKPAPNGYVGTLTELKTIDDVRTLLNKNK